MHVQVNSVPYPTLGCLLKLSQPSREHRVHRNLDDVSLLDLIRYYVHVGCLYCQQADVVARSNGRKGVARLCKDGHCLWRPIRDLHCLTCLYGSAQ